MIYCDPSELRENSHFPARNATPCPGLEALTGADFYITPIPLLLPDNPDIAPMMLKILIDNRALFVQRKTRNDVFSFDELHHQIARMKACGIPRQQAMLLTIGNYNHDYNPTSDINQYTYEAVKVSWRIRGGIVDNIQSEQSFDDWVKAYLKGLEKAQNEPTRLLENPTENLDEIWQLLVPLDKWDWRSIVCSGFPGLGIKTVNEYRELMLASKYDDNLFTFLSLVANINHKNNKQQTQLGVIGKTNHERLRKVLFGEGTKWNITCEEANPFSQDELFNLGSKLALADLEQRMEGKSLEDLPGIIEEVRNKVRFMSEK